MEKEIISNKQGICMMIMFSFGSSIVLGLGSEAKQDVWISMLVAFLMTVPMLIIYAKLLTIYPGRNLYDILHDIFGIAGGKIVSILYVWYSFHLGALVIRNFSEFINIMSFPETPQFIMTIFLGLVSIWVVKAGIEVLGRFSAFTFPIILCIILITLILSVTDAHFINIKPVLYNGIKPVLSSAYSLFSFPFAETVVFTMAFHSLNKNKKTLSVFLISSIAGCGILLLSNLRNILVLGVATATSLYFPSYVAVRTISIGDFLQSFEATIAINYMIAGFVKIGICLYAACNGFAKVFNIKDYRKIVAPIGLLMMDLACIIYTNTSDMFYWAAKIYPYYAFPFQVILPVIIFIVAKIKYRNKNQNLNA